MPRPRADRTNLGNLARLSEIQKSRLHTLEIFARLLDEEVTKAAVQEDDTYFASLVRLAVNDYGVKQSVIAQKLGVSAPAVSRWMSMLSLPVPYVRKGIVEAMEEIISSNVAAQKSAEDDTLLTGTVSAFTE
jgi:hypothetical protein